ncbi:hypothetical protein FACS189434_07710 [Bacteroidia bacterium]|nr:hypothetical protein FACS189434_07710 [Bacteroidia bacterium]
MRKFRLMAFALVIIFNSCITKQNSLTYDKGVTINGVKWATRNVDKSGTFAKNPEDTGMLYQWNNTQCFTLSSQYYWNSDWNGNNAAVWETANNVCPTGWRVPTPEELQSLTGASYKLTTINGIYGHTFGNGKHQIFLPLAGKIYHTYGSYYNYGKTGNYWSNKASSHLSHEDKIAAIIMGITVTSNNDEYYVIQPHPRADGKSVRCVAE